MLSMKLERAINDQVQAEFYSAYMYLGMSLYCENRLFKGMAHWLRLQCEEERDHAYKMMRYMIERGSTPELKDVSASKPAFEDAAELFEKVLEHEQHVTVLVNKLYDLAGAEKDHATEIFLQWFIKEQVEEESSTGEIVQQLKLIGDDQIALRALDASLGARK